MEKQMIVQCPKCQHSRHVHADKIPINAEFATCPKCKGRFRFRTLFKKENAPQLPVEQPKDTRKSFTTSGNTQPVEPAKKTTQRTKAPTQGLSSENQPTVIPVTKPASEILETIPAKTPQEATYSHNEYGKQNFTHNETLSDKDIPLSTSHNPQNRAELSKDHKDIWDAMDFLNESWQTSDLPQSITTKTSLPNEQAQPREDLDTQENILEAKKSISVQETPAFANATPLLRPFPTEKMPLEVKEHFNKETSALKQEASALKQEASALKQEASALKQEASAFAQERASVLEKDVSPVVQKFKSEQILPVQEPKPELREEQESMLVESEIPPNTRALTDFEPPKGSEFSGVTDISDHTDTSNSTTILDATSIADTTDIPETTDTSELADTPNSTAISDATAISELADTPNSTAISDATAISELADTSNSTAISDATAISGLTNISTSSEGLYTSNTVPRLRVQVEEPSSSSTTLKTLPLKPRTKKTSFFARFLQKKEKPQPTDYTSHVTENISQPNEHTSHVALEHIPQTLADNIAQPDEHTSHVAPTLPIKPEQLPKFLPEQKFSVIPSVKEQDFEKIQDAEQEPVATHTGIDSFANLAQEAETIGKIPSKTLSIEEEPVLFTHITQTLEEKVDHDIALLTATEKRPIRDLGLLEELGKHAFDENAYELHEDIPWENIKTYGFIKGFMGTTHMVLFEPGFFFQKFSAKDAFLPAYFFALLQFYLAFICSFLWINATNTFWATPEQPIVLLTPYFSFQNILLLTPLFVGFGLTLLSSITFGIVKATASPLPFFLVFRYLSYSFAPLTLCLIPFAGPFIALLWVFIALYVAYKVTTKKTLLSFILALLPLIALSIGITALLL